MDLEQRIVKELENGENRIKYETHVKRYHTKRGFITKGKIKVFAKNVKKCSNYMVCENGCYGSDRPCEYLVSDTDN